MAIGLKGKAHGSGATKQDRAERRDPSRRTPALRLSRVLNDPLALWIIGPEGAMSIALGWWAAGLPGPRAMRAFIAARSRYAEDELAGAVSSGTLQYVILGAGLDTFAYRNPHAASGLRVFEVDHPDTQAWKRGRLALMGIPVPCSVAFVTADFERRELAAGLEGSGFKGRRAGLLLLAGRDAISFDGGGDGDLC